VSSFLRTLLPSATATQVVPSARATRSSAASASAPSNHSFSATPVLQRQQAAEDTDLRRRRLAAAAAARTAIERLGRALDRGYLLEGEVLTSDGRIDAIYEARIETREVRATRLRGLIRDLRALVIVLDAGPVDPSWFEPRVEEPMAAYGVGGPEAWQDTAALYLHRQQAHGESVEAAAENVFSIQTAPIPTPAIARAPVRTGIGTGIYLIVPDPMNAPLVYRRLTGYEGWQERGVIVEVWSDDFGYFYWAGENRKIYLPGRP
jgi:hypothetical protein